MSIVKYRESRYVTVLEIYTAELYFNYRCYIMNKFELEKSCTLRKVRGMTGNGM